MEVLGIVQEVTSSLFLQSKKVVPFPPSSETLHGLPRQGNFPPTITNLINVEDPYHVSNPHYYVHFVYLVHSGHDDNNKSV